MQKEEVSRRNDGAGSQTRHKMKAVLENVPLAIDCATKWAQWAGFDDHDVYDIQLAVDEACANVVYHAYRGMEAGEMEVCCCLDGPALVIRVRDWGRPFNPDSVPEPDVDAPLEERELGGLGMFLLKQVMDQIQYTFDPEEGNELKMVKRLQVAGEPA